jgi:hypothetical protein
MMTAGWYDDMFVFDVEAWDDTDGDGLTDYIDPNSTVNDFQTVQLCGTSTGTGTGGSGSQPSATGNYLTLATGSSATCTFTLPAGETLDLVVQTKGYGSEGGVTITDPSGTSTSYGPFSSYQFYTLSSDGTAAAQGSYITSGSTTSSPGWTTAGSYTVEY